jgi:hypothetical protein
MIKTSHDVLPSSLQRAKKSVFGSQTDRTQCSVVLMANKESEQSIVIVKVLIVDE